MEETFEMHFDMAAVENLGFKAYMTLPPVIAELVSNAWDADANKVKITIPEGPIDKESRIVVEDDGNGMSKKELDEKFLVIGYHRRKQPDDRSKSGRKLMGRKGIGKLAGFGIADSVTVTSIKDGVKNSFRMVYSEIVKARNGRYRPEILVLNQTVGDEDGTTIELSKMKRTRKINVNDTITKLSNRFTVFSNEFDVRVNDKKLISLKEIVAKDAMFINDYEDECIGSDLYINGWIAILNKIPTDMPAGVTIYSHGKLVQEPFFFNEPGGRHYAYSYMIGSLDADFLDELDEDIVSSSRKEIDWETTPEAQILLTWGKEEILRVKDKRRIERERIKTKEIRDDPEIKPWYDTLTDSETHVVDRTIQTLITSEVPDEKLFSVARKMSKSFESEAYQEILTRFTDTPFDDFPRLIELMQEWSIVESREAYNTIKARLEIIERLEAFVNTNQYEKKLQGHLYDSPWLIHPTWLAWEKEKQLADDLKKKFPENGDIKDRRRVDIICVGAAKELYIIELKRPDVKIGKKDMDQLKGYVAFYKENKGNSEIAYERVEGYLIGGNFKNDAASNEERNIMETAGHYKFQTYREMIQNAKRMHEAFLSKLEKDKIYNTMES